MKKLYSTILLIVVFLFLTTYSPKEINKFSKSENIFFGIKDIKIINNHLINNKEVENKLSNIYGKNILFVKRSEIEKPLKSIDFFEKIDVKKKYPNTIIVKIYETQPIAILFKSKTKYLLDTSSNLIVFKEDFSNFDFPSIFGDGAENNFLDFFKKLKENGFPKDKIESFYYFQMDRWDLQLKNRQIIKFPSEKIEAAIQQSVELLNRKDFQNYNIIDLRINDKIIVE